MLSPGMLIALDVSFLYMIMGPLVLFGIYVLFDSLGQKKDKSLEPMINTMIAKNVKKDPALWSDEDFLL